MNAIASLPKPLHLDKEQQNVMFRDLRELRLHSGGFSIVFQPRVLVKTGKADRVEALVRWTDDTKTTRFPGEFLGLVDRWGYLTELDNWVLGAAIEQAARWAQGDGPSVSVNVSSRQIEDATFPARIEKLLSAAGLPPNRLELEVTESCVIRDASSAGRTLNAIREMNIDVAVDDFGTGQLSISNLQWMPVNVIKLGNDMCTRLSTDARYQRLAKAMVAFAKTLDARTVLEGIETAAQFQVAADSCFDEVQGFLFSRGVPSDDVKTDFSRFITGHHAEPGLALAAE